MKSMWHLILNENLGFLYTVLTMALNSYMQEEKALNGKEERPLAESLLLLRLKCPFLCS
jgi:hypothetical protein